MCKLHPEQMNLIFQFLLPYLKAHPSLPIFVFLNLPHMCRARC